MSKIIIIKVSTTEQSNFNETQMMPHTPVHTVSDFACPYMINNGILQMETT